MRTVYPLGTTIYDPGKCHNGYTLILRWRADAGSDIILIDMNGNTVHSWGVNGSRSPKLLESGHLVLCENLAPLVPYGGLWTALADPGNVLGDSQGQVDEWRQGNVREYGWNGDLVWEYWVDGKTKTGSVAERLPNGNTLFMYKEPLRDEHIAQFDGPRENWSGADHILADCLLEVTAKGEIVWTWKSYDHLDLNNHLEIDFVPNWTHFNGLQSLPENKWYDAGDERFRPGNVLVSPRTLGFIFIIDKQTGKVVWEYSGDYRGGLAGQHEPMMVEKGVRGAGNIVVLDNGIPPLRNVIHAGLSHVLEIDPVAEEIVWKYEAGAQFFTPWGGGVTRLPNGNTLIAESYGRRAFEVTQDGENVWEYVEDSARIQGAYRYTYDHCPQLAILPEPQESAVVPPPHVKTKP